MKYSIVYLIAVAIAFVSCNNEDDDNENICFYRSFIPEIAIEGHSDYSLDIDGDGIEDLSFYFKDNGLYLKSIIDEVEVTKGFYPFSGSYHPILINDTINETLSWSEEWFLANYGNDVFSGGTLDFIGIRKNVDGKIYYGWLAVEIAYNSFMLREIYYFKRNNTPVLAGIINVTCNV